MSGIFARLRAELGRAFSMDPEPLAPEDEAFLDEVARRVAARRLALPALLATDAFRYTPGLSPLLYSMGPLAEPIVPFFSLGIVRTADETRRLIRLAERREHLEALARKIEALA